MHTDQRIRRGGAAAWALFVAGTAFAAPQAGNVQVAVDPASGQLRAPTEQERAALSAAQRQLDAQKNAAPQARSAMTRARPATEAQALRTVRRYPGGVVGGSARVPESLVSDVVAERQSDGSVAVHHRGEAAPANPAPEAIR